MRVTLVQANQFWEDKKKNFNNYKRLLDGFDETDLIVLPEMFNTGFSMNAERLSEGMNEESINWLKILAKEKKAAIYTSLIINQNNLFYNRGVFVHPEGQVEFYNKRKLFSLAGEDEYYTAGNKEVIVEYLGWNINLQICYDLRFPEIVRNELIGKRAKYDLIIYVANWPEKRAPHWNALLKARAIENQCYVIGVNRVGEDKDLSYSGDSQVVNLLGEHQYLESSNEMIKTFVMNKTKMDEIRERLPFLNDRC